MFLYFIKVYVSFVGSGISVAYQTEEISALAHSPGEQHSFPKSIALEQSLTE